MCGYDQKDMMKSIDGYKWNPKRMSWDFPLSRLPDICDIFKVELSGDVKSILDEETEKRRLVESKIDLCKKLRSGEVDPQTVMPWIPDYLFTHQKIALACASQFDSFALFMEPGTGKTATTIELIKRRGVDTLVVAPLSILESVWMAQLAQYAPGLTARNLWRANGMGSRSDYCQVEVVNYQKFKKLPLMYLQERFGMIVFDESSALRAHNTQTTKAAIKASSIIPHRLILTGTPFPNSPIELWGQMNCINPSLLGNNFYQFRNRYFKMVGFGNFLPVCSSINKNIIMNRVGRQAVFYKKEECVDLPEKIFQERFVQMDDQQTTAYKQMEKENILNFASNTALAANQLVEIMKLRQIASGFVIGTDGNSIKISDTKITELKAVLQELGEEQVIIWCCFHWEIKTIRDILKEKSGCLYGEESQSDKEETIERFKAGSIQFLIAHPRSAGHGLNFTNASYAIYFSLDYSFEAFIQSQDRIHRIGQKNKCTYILLLAKGTIDEIVYKALTKKEGMMDAMLAMLRGKRNERA